MGAFSHGGGEDTDPYKPADAVSAWTGLEQAQRVLAFFERHRSDNNTNAIAEQTANKQLNYYVNGADTFRQTDHWPPSHLKSRKFYLGPDQTLTSELPKHRKFDRYDVDFDTGTSASSRWRHNSVAQT